jgi:hypothetical protein
MPGVIAEREEASSKKPVPMLERRRIEAAILKHVYDTLKASHGAERQRKRLPMPFAPLQSSRPKEFAVKA